jgi:NMD protein affecting ribosome stability and mRNA decay
LGNKSDAKAAMVISGDENVLEIMDPETYRTAFAARPRDLQVEPGEEVKVVRTADGFIVI